jgi:hypothetical protein
LTQLIIFFVEIIAIYIFLEYDSLSSEISKFKFLEESNSSYISDNYIEHTLNLNNIYNIQKISQWNHSNVKKEVLLNFPNLQIMSKTIDEKLIDSSDFKKRLISHIEYLHGEYILENITMEEYREKINNINPALPSF